MLLKVTVPIMPMKSRRGNPAETLNSKKGMFRLIRNGVATSNYLNMPLTMIVYCSSLILLIRLIIAIKQQRQK